MDTKALEQLINQMPFDEAEKQSLLGELARGSAPEVLAKMKDLLSAKERKLNEDNPEAAAEHAAADREYEEAVAKAADEFEATMKQIDAEADEAGQEMLKQLDQVRAEEIKDSI